MGAVKGNANLYKGKISTEAEKRGKIKISIFIQIHKDLLLGQLHGVKRKEQSSLKPRIISKPLNIWASFLRRGVWVRKTIGGGELYLR